MSAIKYVQRDYGARELSIINLDDHAIIKNYI